MPQKLQGIRGMPDLRPDEAFEHYQLETTLRQLAYAYGYGEIRTPVLERTQLFKRSVGEATDIVEKEMYVFEDRNGDSLCLRPEMTAPCARSAIEHGLLREKHKWFYFGPLFRHERPQKGRYRQFHQFGLETLGYRGVASELEMLLFCHEMFEQLGVIQAVQLDINFVGSPATRERYREALVAYLSPLFEQLDPDSQRRLTTNPLRILDSKAPQTQALLKGAPSLSDYLDDAERAHWQHLRAQMDAYPLTYQINPRLVRGLDYYTGLVFEWTTDRLGSQAAVAAGGRYDGLIEQLGGTPTPGLGFACGMERLALLQKALGTQPKQPQPFLYVLALPGVDEATLQQVVTSCRSKLPGMIILADSQEGHVKASFKRADRSQAAYALVLEATAWSQGLVELKHLREHCPQSQHPWGEALWDILKEKAHVFSS